MIERIAKAAPIAMPLVGAMALLALAVWEPARYQLLLQEDGPVEWTTAWCFALAASLFALHAKRDHCRWRDRAVPIALAAFCVFVAGEELSWGQRLLTYQPPEAFLAHNYQQESNLHNLLKDIFDSRWQVLLIAATYGVIGPLSSWRGWLPASWCPTPAVLPAMLAVAALEATYPVALAGELAEALLGFAFLQDAAHRAYPEPTHSAKRAAAAMLASMALGATTPPVLDATLYAPHPEAVAQLRAELDELRTQVSSHRRAKLFQRRRVHKRLFTSVQARYLEPLEAPDDDVDNVEATRRRYHLDPWQQPYWLLFVRSGPQAGTAWLYSFGPNRRRDTIFDDEQLPAAMSGDDVGMSIELEAPRR